MRYKSSQTWWGKIHVRREKGTLPFYLGSWVCGSYIYQDMCVEIRVKPQVLFIIGLSPCLISEIRSHTGPSRCRNKRGWPAIKTQVFLQPLTPQLWDHSLLSSYFYLWAGIKLRLSCLHSKFFTVGTISLVNV